MKIVCPILGRPTEVEATEYCRDRWSVVRCTETQFVFLKDPPAYEALESELAWEVTFQAERARRFEEEPLLSRVSVIASKIKFKLRPNRNRFLKLVFGRLDSLPTDRPLSVIDVGCGGGDLLQVFYNRLTAENRQVIPIGIEVSKQLARQAGTRLAAHGGRVIQKNAIEGAAELPPRSVDVVVMSSFLEHESKPLDLLRRLHGAMADRGIVILKVPNFGSLNRRIRGKKWCGFRYPDHVNYFTPATLSRLSMEAGFDCHQSLADASPVSDNMYAVLTKRCEPSAALRRAA